MSFVSQYELAWGSTASDVMMTSSRGPAHPDCIKTFSPPNNTNININKSNKNNNNYHR
jgi:hypothetical protein